MEAVSYLDGVAKVSLRRVGVVLFPDRAYTLTCVESVEVLRMP